MEFIMSNYLKKMPDNEYTPLIDAGIAKVLTLCSIVNRKTELCCMVNDSAHCRHLEVDLYPTNESVTDRRTAPVKFRIEYKNTGLYPDNRHGVQSLERFAEVLEQCLNDRKIPYDTLYPVMHEVVKHYQI